MKILITGGLGYIGGRIATYLKEKRPDTNISLATRNKKRQLPYWSENFNVFEIDLLDEDSIFNCFKDRNIDVIIHLAAMNEIESLKDPELALKVNTQGTYKLLNIANTNKVKQFIYFSTFHVYGEINETNITEETSTKPYHPYAINHRAAEDFVNYFKHYYGMKTLIFRLSNVYGYPMDININRWTLVFNDLCRQAVTTGRIVLRSSGRQHRDFISLQDVARAVHHFIYVAPDEWGDGLYNLGGNRSMSILEVVEKIKEIYKGMYKREILEISTKSDDVNTPASAPVIYNIQKLEKTGFHLEDNFYHEIQKTMELCEEFIR